MPIGRTVHIVSSYNGNWQVVDLNRHVLTFPNRTSAVKRAKALAKSKQPSQVVLFDERGQPIHLARYQLPEYRWETGGSRLIQAAVKAGVIRNLVSAGADVAQELLDSVDRDLKSKEGDRKSQDFWEAKAERFSLKRGKASIKRAGKLAPDAVFVNCHRPPRRLRVTLGILKKHRPTRGSAPLLCYLLQLRDSRA